MRGEREEGLTNRLISGSSSNFWSNADMGARKMMQFMSSK
jgi:hypothetical protein